MRRRLFPLVVMTASMTAAVWLGCAAFDDATLGSDAGIAIPERDTAADSPSHIPIDGATDATVLPNARVVNLSTRLNVGTGDGVVVTTLTLSGSGKRRVVLRALGPSLAAFGLTGLLPDPSLIVFDGTGNVIATNDAWQSDPSASSLGELAPKDPLEPGLALDLDPGSYTLLVRGEAGEAGGGQNGLATIEAYDLGPGGAQRLTSLSTRGQVLGENGAMIAGFIIGGTDSLNVLLRGIGPTLVSAGINGALVNPILELHGPDGGVLAVNDSWEDAPEKDAIVATGQAPTNTAEAAILRELPPGTYTLILKTKAPALGIGRVDVLELMP